MLGLHFFEQKTRPRPAYSLPNAAVAIRKVNATVLASVGKVELTQSQHAFHK
jgi:hypothetical protein